MHAYDIHIHNTHLLYTDTLIHALHTCMHAYTMQTHICTHIISKHTCIVSVPYTNTLIIIHTLYCVFKGCKTRQYGLILLFSIEIPVSHPTFLLLGFLLQ